MKCDLISNVTLSIQDLKFVQAEVSKFTNLAVVTRFKRDFLHVGKKGGRVISSSDSRVTFIADRGTFKGKENFILQVGLNTAITRREILYMCILRDFYQSQQFENNRNN